MASLPTLIKRYPKKLLRALMPNIKSHGDTWTATDDDGVATRLHLPSRKWKRAGGEDEPTSGVGFLSFVSAARGVSKAKAKKLARWALRELGLLTEPVEAQQPKKMQKQKKLTEPVEHKKVSSHPSLARHRYFAMPADATKQVLDLGVNPMRIMCCLHAQLAYDLRNRQTGHLWMKDEELLVSASHADFEAWGVKGSVAPVIERLVEGKFIKVVKEKIGRTPAVYQLILSWWFDPPTPTYKKR